MKGEPLQLAREISRKWHDEFSQLLRWEESRELLLKMHERENPKMKKTHKFTRGDAVSVMVKRKATVATIVATIEREGKPDRFRLLTADGKTVERSIDGITPGEDRNKLTEELAKKV